MMQPQGAFGQFGRVPQGLTIGISGEMIRIG
jgi:hypothetical protein